MRKLAFALAFLAVPALAQNAPSGSPVSKALRLATAIRSRSRSATPTANTTGTVTFNCQGYTGA